MSHLRPWARSPLNLLPLGLAVALGAATACEAPDEATDVIDPAELATVVGGVSTQVVWPPSPDWNQSYDNLRFQIAVQNHFGTNSASLIAGANGTKVGQAIVATPGPGHTGTWHARMDWPFPGKKQLQLRYVNPQGQTFSTYDQPTLDGQALHGGVKVHTVKFWNAVSPSMSTYVSPAISKALVDNLNAAIPTRTTNVDGIYAESCGTWTKTQWRFAGVDTLTISDTCMDMVANGGTYAGCLNEFNNSYSADTDNVHVVYIKTNQSNGAAGAHWRSGSAYSITIRDDWEGNADLDALLAHELGHTYVGGHTNGQAGANCGGTRVNRNLMCDNVGRVMNATQCSAAVTSNRYTDRN